MTIIDTHAHLDQLKDLDQALERANAAGVEGIMTVSEGLASGKRNLEIKKASSRPRIYLGFGIHPGTIKPDEVDACMAFIRENISEASVIGEIGLDFWYKWVRKDKEKKDEQREIFRLQLVLAKEYDLPVVIHSRGTWRECFQTTKELGVTRAVFHWYSGPLDVLEDIIANGYFVSTTPSLAYSPQVQEAMTNAPIEQTLIETDCPVFYRGPDGAEGFESEPRDVFKTLELYARLKDVAPQDALAILNNNARTFLGIGNEKI